MIKFEYPNFDDPLCVLQVNFRKWVAGKWPAKIQAFCVQKVFEWYYQSTNHDVELKFAHTFD